MISYATTYSAMYDLVADDPTVAALLGNGTASSIFERPQLRNLSGRVLPWLVWAYGPVNGDTGKMGDVFGNWWAYIPKAANTKTLYEIAAAVESAYKSQRGMALTGGRLYIGPLGQPTVDSSLDNIQGLQIPVYFRALR